MGRRQASCPTKGRAAPDGAEDTNQRLSAFRFLDLFGEGGEANEKAETHRSVLVRKPKVRASRGWILQNSGADAPRERWRSSAPAIAGRDGAPRHDGLRLPPCHGCYAPATKRKILSEDSGSGRHRRRVDRRLAGGDAVAHGAGRQIAPLRHQAGPARRGEGALQAGERDARLSGPHQERQYPRRLCLDHARGEPLSDRARLSARRQERDAGKADRARIVGGRRADPIVEPQQSEIHHRLFAALQSEDRLRQEEDHRRHARQCRFGAGQPASVARTRQEDRKPGAAVAGGDGIDPRSRFRVLAAWSRRSRCASTAKAPMAI